MLPSVSISIDLFMNTKKKKYWNVRIPAMPSRASYLSWRGVTQNLKKKKREGEVING
jgi:hypothetical protein